MHPSTTLYFREGSSDKVYQCAVQPVSAGSGQKGFHVSFAYGRRGSTLTRGFKTTQPVTLDEATNIHEKLVREKKAKGYTEAADGTPTVSATAAAILNRPAAAEDEFLKAFWKTAPMLLNEVTEKQAMKLLAHPDWCVQEKLDGRRLTVRVHLNGTTWSAAGFNKLSKPVHLSAAIHEAATAVKHPCVLDGEAVGDDYHVFDLLELDGKDLRPMPYRRRIGLLQATVLKLGTTPLHEHLHLVWTAENKQTYLTRMREKNAEGIVLKRLSAPWSPGRPNSGGDALKFKFHATASFIVEKVNGTKRSVALSLVNFTTDPTKPVDALQHCAGNVTIPPNKPVPKPGAIVEVRYLYAFPESGRVFQPVYLGPRDDVERRECHTGQLKFKAA